jgi:hypothetical protein
MGMNGLVTIKCPRHHIDFKQGVYKHLNGHGCPECTKERIKRPKITHEEYVARSRKVHGFKYEYRGIFQGSGIPINILCPEHGVFKQAPFSHWSGRGCPECGRKKKGLQYNFEKFKVSAIHVHGTDYSYDESTFVNMDTPMRIICSSHGEFWQRPRYHINRSAQGCPKCAHQQSKGENEISEWLTKEGFLVIPRFKYSGRKEIDIYLPEYKLGIEFNGLLWHSSRYSGDARIRHISKTNDCVSLGIRLIQIWDWEWLYKKDICKEIVLFALRKISRRIFARNCNIKEISAEVSNTFLEENHIQGSCKANFRIGLFLKEELVGVQCYSAPNRGGTSLTSWLITRTAFLKGVQVVGGISKMFCFFVKNINPDEVVDYTDRRFFVASGHHQMGFSKKEVTLPHNYLTDGRSIYSRRYYRHKNRHFRYRIPWDDALTDTENLANNGWYWVWDCGKIKNAWKRPVL